MTKRLVRIAIRSLPLGAALASAALWPSRAHAQVIPLRTVPVASGDQFLLLPSTTLGMGGVTVAVDDPLGDGWINPAKGALVDGPSFLGAPTYYGISNGGGGGRTFPLAGLFGGDAAFGGVALALQQIENTRGGGTFGGPVPVMWPPVWPEGPRTRGESSRNLYGAAFFGLRLGSGWSIGLGASAASLHAMDGVDLLYAGSSRIEQSGSAHDVRLGVYHAGERDRFEALLLHSRVSMEHDVTYLDWVVDSIPVWTTRQVPRVEQNEDRARTWGGHLGWDRSLSAPGWRVGASATVNRKDHPKIPNYQIQNIPRDPGLTWAYEGALGVARTAGPTTFALDVAFQPIWSDTWQEADTADVTASGGTLRVGDRSIENDFFFTNVMLRSGLAHEVGRATLHAGIEARSYAYTLEQANHVDRTHRDQDETWMEWTPTFGIALAFTDLEVRYAGRVTSGTGRPATGDVWGGGVPVLLSQSAGGDFLVAPSGPLTLEEVSVVTHQLAVRLAVR